MRQIIRRKLRSLFAPAKGEVSIVPVPASPSREVRELRFALSEVADVLGDGMTAHHVAPVMTCSEVDRIAGALVLGGFRDEAASFLFRHAQEDGDGDAHEDLDEVGVRAYLFDQAA